MDKKLFQNLIDILDEEINAYSKMKEYFSEKKEILKKAKPDDLGVLDNKIIALNNQIVKLNNSRKELADALSERKVKICKLIPELMLLNNQNVELLKHGIIISNKMLETIIDAFAPQGCNYNGAGKTDSQEYDLWTINEEI